jgi:hypothetical protein
VTAGVQVVAQGAGAERGEEAVGVVVGMDVGFQGGGRAVDEAEARRLVAAVQALRLDDLELVRQAGFQGAALEPLAGRAVADVPLGLAAVLARAQKDGHGGLAHGSILHGPWSTPSP